LIVVPGVPVYYARSAPANVFFYADDYWAFHDGGWYVSPTWNGPWTVVASVHVPVPILRIPVGYYSVRPSHWKSWRRDAPRSGRRNTGGTGGKTTVSAAGGTGKRTGTDARSATGIRARTAPVTRTGTSVSAVTGTRARTVTVTKAARDVVTVSAMTDRGGFGS
jgi:hypothetical protein